MTSHTHWSSPAVEQRRDLKEEWENLVKYLTASDLQKERRSGRTILDAS